MNLLMRVAIIFLFLGSCLSADYRPPAGTRTATRRPGAESILPGGRMIDPLGRQFPTGPGVFGLAISPDGKFAVTANGGPDRYSLTILDMQQEPYQVRQLVAKTKDEKAENEEQDWRSVFMGLAFADDHRLFASEGNSGRVREISVPSGRFQALFHLNQGPWRDSYSGDIAYDSERHLLFVADQANFRVAVFDARSRKLLSSARVGRLPFKLALSPDKRRLYVTNLGMFEYKALPKAEISTAVRSGLPFPAFGFPSEAAAAGAQRQTENGPVAVPGLGEPNADESNSLCVLDVSDAAAPKLVQFVRTGEPFGAASEGGSSPSGVVASEGLIFVSNANQDSITVIDAVSLRVRESIPLRIAGLESFRGILPIGLHLDPLNGRLLVAEAGINAIGVVDLASNRLTAHLPAGWFPTCVASDRGRIFVASARGAGTGPNASKSAPFDKTAQADLRNGTLHVFESPLNRVLPMLTQRVMTLNGFSDRKSGPPPLPIEIRYVVIVVKENRTYDEVLGDVASDSVGELRAAPELARFGRRGWVEKEPGMLKTRLDRRFFNITPNHHALAARYAFSDNFYADSEVSVDGHHWLAGSYPNAWTESSLMASYGGQKDFRLSKTAPGRLSFPESNSSIHPEEQLESGAIWHHLERNGISFRNFGEGFELAGNVEDPGEKPTGARLITNVPMPEPLFRNTSRDYPGFNMNIPDQYRASQFISEIESRYVATGQDLPRLIFLQLPADHMARPRPADGYPFGASYVADNDYALGRIVEYLSKSRWWKQMAVFITEDDAQGGVDHVDSHRTLFFVASPFARRNFASRTNASFPALLKIAFRILGIPPLNLYDATAADLSDCFGSAPDFTAFDAVQPEPQIFEPSEARESQSTTPGPKMDDPEFIKRQHERD